MDFALDGRTHRLQFEAFESGHGTLLLLDPRSSLVEPAQPLAASWSKAEDGAVVVAGRMKFPVGNVGERSGLLTLTGRLSGRSFAGIATFANASFGEEPSSGHFSANRVEPPRVTVDAPGRGAKVRRGARVVIEWEVDAATPVASQRVLVSVDGGSTWEEIAAVEADARVLTWAIPESLRRTNRAMVKVVVVDADGAVGDATSAQFRLR